MMDADDALSTDKNIIENGTYADRAINILSSCYDISFVHPMTLMFGEENKLINNYPLTESLVMQKHHVPTWIVYRKEEALCANLYSEAIDKWQDWSFAG